MDIEKAFHLHQAGRWAEARAGYKSILRRAPGNCHAWHLLGLVNLQLGKPLDAATCIKRALTIEPGDAEAHYNLGTVLTELRRFEEATRCFERAAAINPGNPEAHNSLGSALGILHRHEQALACFERALAIKADHPAALYNAGNALTHLGRHAEAIGYYERALASRPDDAAVHNALGIALAAQNRCSDATRCFERSILLKPDDAEAHYNLGLALKTQGEIEKAVSAYRKALSFRPDYTYAHYNLGNALQELGRLDDAVASFRKALSFKPDFAEAHNNLGNALQELGRPDDAVASFHKALSFKPDFIEAHNSLGNALQELGRPDDAVASLHKALSFKPDYAEAHNNLGNALRDQGRLNEAISSYRQAVSLKPDFALAYSNLLFTMQFCHSESASNIKAEHERFAAQFEAPLKPEWQPHANTRELGRRLKVGYVSPDFRNHAVAYFIEPVLANHDKDRVEVFCYHIHARHDEFTGRVAGYADRWLDCNRMTDAQLADRIRSDGIDILVDLAGHTARNRMLTFARKPAPIQITYLGYPGTSGLSAMDYRLTDDCADSQGSDAYYTEKLLRLPDSLWCYRPRKDMPEITALPAQQNGYLTFGSFNNFNKIDSRCIELWAQLLLAVPRSRLLLVTVPEDSSRQRLADQFAARGVAAERLEFHGMLPGNEFHRMLQRADISLDPVTVNGATTTCESLWLGVPVISLVGTRFLERAGFSILSAAGLHDFAAATPQGCIEVAVRLADSLPQLAQLRLGLRTRVAGSPLVDEVKFTRSLETIYREFWTKWCSTVT